MKMEDWPGRIEMPRIASFRELEVYQLGLREAKKVFMITKAFPREEKILVDGSDSPIIESR